MEAVKNVELSISEFVHGLVVLRAVPQVGKNDSCISEAKTGAAVGSPRSADRFGLLGRDVFGRLHH